MSIGLKADSEYRYQLFIDTVKKERIVWGLKCSEGWAVSPSNDYEDRNVMPFWSHKAYAEQVAVEDWKGYIPSEIPLQEFVNNWLQGMSNDGVMVGLNWNKQLIGKEIDAAELYSKLIL
jgi:hypothetical protein